MAILGIKVEDNKKAHDFLEQTAKRITYHDIVKNPFNGLIKPYPSGDNMSLYLIIMEPVYIKIYYLGLVMLLGGLIISGFKLSFWVLPGAIMSASYFFWSPSFIYIMMRLGFRKAGYKGKVKRISKYNLIKRIVNFNH